MAIAADAGSTVAAAGDTSPPTYSKAYVRYAMWLLLGIYIVNFVDRSVINILAEPIKQDLGLTDWQLGMMSGLAFAILYTFLGIPVARLAEHSHRPRIISVAAATWSLFTILCAYAGNFWQLLLFRVGVGVGEAGCTPPAHSLIVDYHPIEKRASALAFYSLGGAIGTLLGLIIGGLVYDAYGWRVGFLVAGSPGLFFAVLAFFTLKEPRRIMARHVAATTAKASTFGQTLAYLAKTPTFWCFAAGATIFNFGGGATFTVSFFLRIHTAEVNLLAESMGLKAVGFLGLTMGLSNAAGALGIWMGGWITDRFGARDLRNYVVAPAVAALLMIPLRIGLYTVDSTWLALGLMTVVTFLGGFWWGPVFSIGQSVVPSHMRATSAAILLFTINLLGAGMGPVALGLLSDYFNRGLGMGPAEGVRWALIASVVTGLGAFAAFWMARRTIRQDFLT
ncbi:spinster family MFS transporter [Phenylobacterium sp.]|uniref:spinster family MFS transporter n=1 Tax=Phenylobacterium sp. TaxID=1871053 RepID=UPI0011FD03B6|nr:MFS transporter [Phenylobacterium sp.]TAL34605.1 MAG: MFS transporter [Phenylobacterium sp.]